MKLLDKDSLKKVNGGKNGVDCEFLVQLLMMRANEVALLAIQARVCDDAGGSH